ncbi:hypothetical protein QE152_g8340 [Popillia japonica]|uniref:CCHC-type domain-containing protein n=1 Tax=Popillia japonica TaxID=7064 RepID=A0AAW1MCU8_POPJA
MDKGGINDIGKLYEIIEKLEKRATSDGIHQMNLVPIGNINIDYLQKCTESVFRGTNRNAPNRCSEEPTIIMDKEKQPNIRGAKGGSKTEKVIIKAGGKQYADILRTVKNSINIDQAGINVKTIKKTMRGDVMMEVKGGKEKAEALRQEILKKNEGTRVEITNQNGTVYVTGIDGDVTKNEIVQGVEITNQNGTVYVTGIDGDVTKNEISERNSVRGAVDASDIEVVSIRPTQYGRQNATVVIKTEWIKKLVVSIRPTQYGRQNATVVIKTEWIKKLCAPTQYGRQNATVVIKTEWIKKLCAKETIRIGWTPCRIRQRINITRCYRCLEFGHQKWECQGEDKTRICLKCGENDHRAKDCVGQSFCFTCKTKGHRADQTRCPHYRKLIQEKTRDVIAGKGKDERTSCGPDQMSPLPKTNPGENQGYNWQVLEEETLTEHRYILFEVNSIQGKRDAGKQTKVTVDWEAFKRRISIAAQASSVTDHNKCIKLIQQAYKKSIQTRNVNNNSPYWWSSDISEKRKRCNQLRRKQQQSLLVE